MRVTLSLVLPMFSVALAAQQFSLSPPNLLLQHDSISHSVRNSVTLPAGYFAVSQAATSSAVFVAAYTVADSNYDAALLSFDANSLTLNFKASFPLPGNQYPASLASAADGTFTLAVYSDSTRPSSLLYLRLDAHTGALLGVSTSDPQALALPSLLPLPNSLPDEPSLASAKTPERSEASDNSPAPPAVTFCVPASDPTPADCDTVLAEDPVTPGALAGRTPLILIHDAWATPSLSTLDRSYWNSLLAAFAATPQFLTRYKVFRFHYVTGQRNVWDLARSLRNHLDALIFNQPEYDTQFTLIGHGLGGLLARSYMDHHWHWSGPASSVYRTRRAGERVLWAITLAAPHNGTPLFTSSSLAAQAVTAGFWNARGCLNCGNLADYANGLAISPAFDHKVIAYWGYIDTNSAVAALARASQAELAGAGSIEASGITLERLLNSNRSHANAQLSLANDGYIPGSSAAFDQRSPAKRVACPNHDHTLMLYGSAAPCSSGVPLLNSVLADLGTPTGAVTPSTPPPVTPYTPPAGCSYTLAPATANHSYNSATNAVIVTTTAGCSWQVQSHAPWISITATSANSFTYLVDTNSGAFPRFGLISVGGSPFYVAQDSVTGACVYDIDPNFRTYSSSPISGIITVLSPSTCSWTPSADSPWLSVSTTSLQTGTKPLPVTGSANTSGQPRFGAVRITPASGAPLLAQVAQEASTSPCSYSLSSSATRISTSGGTGLFAIQTTGSCSWSAAASDSWITLSSSASGTGSANISFSIQANASSSRRFGTIAILAGNTSLSHQIAQEAAAAPAPTINVPSTSISFGNSLVDRATYQVVAVRNTGQATLYPAGINQVSGSLGFQVETPLTPIPAGGAVYFVLSYTPGGQVSQSAIFRLTSNDPAEGTIDLSLSGTGIGAAAGNNLIVAPSTISFGEVPTGGVAEIPLTIQNRDVTPLNLTYNWTQSGDFRVLNAPASLAVNAAATLRLRLLPTSTGIKSATFRVTSSGTGTPSYDVTISATAVAPPAANIQTVRTISLSGSGTPAHLTIRSGRAYISRNSPAGLSIVDLATGTVSANIPISTYSTASAGQPAVGGARAFVPLSNLGSNGQVAVFDLNTNALLQYFAAGSDPHGAVVVDNQLWISNANCPPASGLSMVRAFDTTTLVSQSTQLAGRVAAWLAADTDTRRIAVANTGCGSPNPAAGASLIDLNSNLLLQTRDLRPSPNSVAIAGGKAYFNTGQSVEVVDLSSFATVASIPIPESSDGIAATGGHVFTASGGVVTVISTVTHRVIGTISVPGAIALAADTASATAYAVTPTSLVGIRVQQPSFDFSCAAPALLGPSTTCSVSPVDGFSSAISLTCASVPGVSCLWSPSTIAAPGTATLTITPSSLPPGHYPLMVQASGGGVSRSATLSLASPSCSFTVTQGTHGFGGAGGSSSVEVQSPTGCAWTAASNAAWITITSGSSYSGNGTVAFTVAANPAASARSGTLTVAGQTITVEQQAAQCSYQLNPTSITVAGTAGTGSVSLTTSLSSCAWTAVSDNPAWLNLTSAASGTGPATVAFSFTANPSTSLRQGSLTIGGVTFPVIQSGASCTFTLNPGNASFGAAAQTGSVGLTASNASCQWTASAGAPWLGITSPTSGTGSSTVLYSVAANTDLAARSATLTVAGQAFSVNQDAATCAFTINPSSASLNNQANTGAVSVTAIPAACSWNATSNAGWLSILSGSSGTGNGSVSYSVPANPDPTPRNAVLTVAGQAFPVTQAGSDCSFTLSPTSSSPTAAGGSLSLAVQTSHVSCAWSAVSNSPWITISPPASGTGSGTVSYTVAANPGLTERIGSLVVGGTEFHVTQAGDTCRFTVDPLTLSFDASTHFGVIAVSASHSACTWTASSPAPWIAVTSGESATGSGNVAITVAVNSATQARTANLTVAGNTVRVDQDGLACAYSLSSESAAVDALGGTLSVNVLANTGGCGWTGVSNAAWITVTGGSGSGNGSVAFGVAANPNLVERTGTLTIAGRTFTVTQAALACSISLSPSSQSASYAAGSGTLSVTANHPSCAWTASSAQPWLTLAPPSSGSGSSSLNFSFAANTAPTQRQAAINVSGQSFVLTQAAAPCTYTLSPQSSQNVSATAGSSSVSVVSSNSACSWTATSPASWVSITAGASHTGSGPVGYSFTANPTTNPRSATLTIAGLPFNVVQAGTCSLTLDPASNNAANSGGDYTVAVTASSSSCAWTAAPSHGWVTLLSTAAGTGNGSLSYRVAANPDAASRTSQVTVGDQLHTVVQAAASCVFSLPSGGASFGALASTGSFALSPSSPSCPWTAASIAGWITLTSAASGTGAATISFALAANPDTTARTGVITAGGQSYSITQTGAPCSFTLTPSSQSFGAEAATGSVAVGAGSSACPWTATSNAPWITLTSAASGAGSGSVSFSVAANTDLQPRSGTISIAGQTFQVTQAAAVCSYSIQPASGSYPPAGGTFAVNVSTSPASCPWTASTTTPWISVTSGASGAGPGSVGFSVGANTAPAPRSGSLTIAGKTFPVTQQGVNCQFTVTPLLLQHSSGGGSGFIDVSASSPSCAWSAIVNDNWISLTPPLSGIGSASLPYTIASYSGLSGRSGSLSVAGSTVSVNQSGVQCALTLSDDTAYAGAGGVSQSVSLTLTHSACPWTAVSDANWLTITSASSGTGSSSLNFSVAPLPSQGARTAHLTINGETLTVDQFGISQPGRTPTAVFRHTSGGIAVASYASSSFKLNGGIFGGEPASAQDALGNTYFASLDRHGGAYANTFLAALGSWAQLRFGGGDFQGNLSLAATPNGTVFVAGRDRWRGYWATTFSTAGGFAPWTRLGGVFDTDPSIAASPDGSVYLLGRDTWGGLWANRFVPDSGWQGWTFGGGVVSGKPSVAVGTDGVAYVAVRDYFGSLWMARLRHRRWLNWSFGAGSGLSSDPVIVANGTGTVYVVARTFGGTVYYRGFTEGTPAGWHPWVDAGGVLAAASAAGSSGELYVFGRDPNGYHWWFRAGASQWTNVGNRNYSVTGPAAAPR